MQKNLDGLFDMINELKGEIVELEGELTASQKTSEERKIALEYANSQIKGMANQLGNQSELIVKLAREKHAFAEQMNKDSWYIAKLNKDVEELKQKTCHNLREDRELNKKLFNAYMSIDQYFKEIDFDEDDYSEEDEDIDDIDDIDEFR